MTNIRISIIKTIVEKEFKELMREKKMRGILFGAPIFMLLMFGYAVNTDVKNIAMAVLDDDKTAASRSIIRSFTGTRYFKHYSDLKSDAEIAPLLDSGKADVCLRIERGLSDKLKSNRSASVQIIINGADSSRASVISAYVNEIISSYYFDRLKSGIQARLVGRGGSGTVSADTDPSAPLTTGAVQFRLPQGIEVMERSFFNPSLQSRNFFLPGVIVLLVSLVTIMLTAMSIVKEREIGTIDQIIVSPIRPYEFMIGKTIPFAVIGFIDLMVVTFVSIFFFDVPFNGSIVFLFFSGIVYIISSLAVGLYISTISATQQQAMLSSFLYFFPAQLFSGFIFPIYSMPETIQYITYIIPLRYFITIVRSVFLKGAGFYHLWPDLLALSVIGITMMVLSARRFKRRLE